MTNDAGREVERRLVQLNKAPLRQLRNDYETGHWSTSIASEAASTGEMISSAIAEII